MLRNKYQKILRASILAAVLLSVGYSFFYWLLAAVSPASFYGLSKESSFIDFLYFSLLTITTTGYGDIFPQTPLARLIVFTEIIAGIVTMGLIIYSNTRRMMLKNRKDN